MKKLIDINNVISKVWKNSIKLPIIKENEIVSEIVEEVNYIHPKLKVIKQSDTGSIILISAPGAVGKTTFAKYFAKQKKGYYWDLSKIKLGDNSFLGTIADVHGSSNLSAFLDSIRTGEICLFIDAFDEAEIRSGIDGVLKFIEEVYSYCKTSKRPNIVCFSRSETAEFLQLKLMELETTDDFSVYEIDYFDKTNSISFIKREIEVRGDRTPNIHPQPFKDAIDAIFSKIGSGMNVKGELWDDLNLRSFLGYAPVLQTIAGYLFEQNYNEIASKFNDTSDNQSGINVITDFIYQLLKREQKKLVQPLAQEFGVLNAEWDNWNDLFKPEEQIKIVFDYLVQNQLNIYPEILLPKWLEQGYKDAVKSFISNHPFIKNKKYSSPAFRDYSIAKLLFEEGFNDNTTSFLSKGEFATTQLFANFYHSCHEGNCLGQHVGFLYESATSKKQLDDGMLFTYIEKSDSSNYSIEILSPEDEKSSTLTFNCILDEENFLVFERRLVNADINIQNSKIIFGKPHNSIELNDVNIVSDEIIFRAEECIINCYDSSSSITAGKVTEESSYFKVNKIGDENFEVFWPNANIYPWTNYYSENLEVDIEDETMKDKIYSLQRILSPFRKHKRKEFAKHSEYIENKIVGSNPTRQRVLKFLIEQKILNKDRTINQYVIDENSLAEIGITWDNIKNLRPSSDVINFLKQIE